MVLDYKEFTKLVEQFAGELPELLAGHHKTRDLAPRVQRLLDFAETRFTLAVVGQMRAGKSSLLNAVIGADLAVVGVNETTATTNWFTHGTGERTRRFRVHWKGRPPEDKDLAERGQWSGESSLAVETRKLEFFADTDFLKTADVVDTPGTRSLLSAHQDQIDTFLAKKAAEAEADTRMLGSGADAILYVVPPVPRQSDADLLEDFQHTTRLPNSPPYNSLAVVHKWETLESEDPYAEACRKAERIYQAMKDFISGAFPVSAPLGWAAERFPDSFWTSAMDLAQNTATADFEELLLDGRDFVENIATSCPLDATARSELREQFRIPWPCLRVLLRLARQKAYTAPSDLRKLVLDMSGLLRLRHEIQHRFFARARVLRMSKLLATAWEPCDRAQHLLRNYKLDINHDLGRAERARVVLAERISSGDTALLPAQEFVQSAASKLGQEMTHVGENLRCLGEIVLKVKDTHEQMERDLCMLDILDQSTSRLPPEMVDMLRCLFGRAGADVASRLSFYSAMGKTAPRTADLDDAIGKLQRFIPHTSGKVKVALDHGVERLEQIANWMEDSGIAEISLVDPLVQK